MSPSIDFSDVKGLEPIPAGTYLATVSKATPGTSNSGNEKIDLRWMIEEGDHAERIIFDTLVWHPKALFRIKQTLIAFGYDDDYSGDVDAEELEGNSAMLVIDIEASSQVDPATGEPYPPRNRVKRVLPVS